MRTTEHHAPGVAAIAGAQRALALVAVAQLHPAVAEIAADVQASAIKRRIGDEVDVGGHRFSGDVGRERLVDDELLKDHRRNRVKTVGTARAAFVGAGLRDAVDAHRGPAVGRAAHLNVAGLALIALHGNAGKAGERGGDVLVGEATDRVSRSHVDQVGRFALFLDSGLLRLADRAGDDDEIVRSGLGILSHCRCGKAGKYSGAGEQRDAGGVRETVH